jgi:hypothetical protein
MVALPEAWVDLSANKTTLLAPSIFTEPEEVVEVTALISLIIFLII